MKIKLILLTGLIAFFALSASAEFYRYKDENGVYRYTDNLMEVPEDQRPKVYNSTDSDYKPPEKKERQEPPPPVYGEDPVLKRLLEEKRTINDRMSNIAERQSEMEKAGDKAMVEILHNEFFDLDQERTKIQRRIQERKAQRIN